MRKKKTDAAFVKTTKVGIRFNNTYPVDNEGAGKVLAINQKHM